ncbi:MAG: hypothetical protein EU536_02245 [Promethearchaeota archaeon]|nr:MAG: hypothetical protein EU536_02245 [Candidatus Lokiarchaeota archaeon]
MSSSFDALLNRVRDFSMAQSQFEKEYSIGSWGKGLLLYGLLAKYLYDQDHVALDFVDKWINQSIETQTADGELSGGDPSQANFALIGLSVLYFAENRTEPKKYAQSLEKQGLYLLNLTRKRTKNGALYYMKALPQVWVDTVIMICPFLARAGIFLENPRFTDEAVRQLELHIDYLKDPETGLYRHIWDESQKKFYEGSLWGRGNGWMLTSLVEVAERLATDHPKKNRLINEIQRLAEKLILCQDESGLWRLFLDKLTADSKLETAGSLVITYGLSKAIRNEWLDPEFAEYVQNSFEAVIKCVDRTGMVSNASGPTINPKHTPYNKPYAHAQGLFLMMALEITKLMQFLREKQLV